VLNRSKRMALVSKVGLAGAIMFATLTLSLGTNVTISSAGDSPFCTTLFSFEGIAEKNETPKEITAKGYVAWAKLLLPYYKKLASEAPANGKVVLNELVTIFKYYSNAKTIAGIQAYIAANHAKFEAGTKALAKDIEACA
jgi:ABC-type phosphate transport system substrate-binding protein